MVRDEVLSGVVFKNDEAGGGSVFMVRSVPEPQAETGAETAFLWSPFKARSLLVRLLRAFVWRVLLSARFLYMVLLVRPRVDVVIEVF